MLWPVKGFIEVTAGIDINILIFDGGADLGIKLTAMLRIQDINKQGWVTMADVFWLVETGNFLRAIIIRLKLDLLFDLYIKACIPIPFAHLCWTVVRWDFSFNLFDKVLNSGIPPIASNTGEVDLTQMRNPSTSVWSIFDTDTDTNIQLLTDGKAKPDNPTQSRECKAAKEVTFKGGAGSGTRYHVMRTLKRVNIPSGAALDFNVSSFGLNTQLAISNKAIVPNSAPGISWSGRNQCPEVNLQSTCV